MLVMLAFPGIFQNRQIIAQSLRLIMLAVFLRLDIASAEPQVLEKRPLTVLFPRPHSPLKRRTNNAQSHPEQRIQLT